MVSTKDFTFILSTRSYQHLGALQNVDVASIEHTDNMASANELSFDVYKELDDIVEPLWKKIAPLRLIYVPELGEHGEYFEIDPDLKDSREAVVKTLTCTSLCEAELSQTNIEIEVNNENDINWFEDNDEFLQTVFYNPNKPEASLMHRVLDKMPQYTIGHVDDSLKNLVRILSLNGDILGCLQGEIAEQFTCLFTFDSTTRTVNAYDLAETCNNCGYRGEFDEYDRCPECGSDSHTYYGEDTTIYVDKENLTEEIQFETDTSSIKNCFKLEAGDEMMTTAVIAQNPNGSQYIYYLTDETMEDMPQELQAKIRNYNTDFDYYQNQVAINLDVFEFNNLVNKHGQSYNDQFIDDKKTLNKVDATVYGYPNLMLAYYQAQDLYHYINSSMMPNRVNGDITATTEAQKLTAYNLSPLALSNITNATSAESVESSLKNYAKVYCKTGFVKLDVITTSLSANYMVDAASNKYKEWQGYIKVTNYSDEEDVMFACALSSPTDNEELAYRSPMTIKVYDNYEEFMKQKIIKSIKSDDDDDNTVYNILDFKIYDDQYNIVESKVSQLRTAVNMYSRNRARSFADAFQTALDVLLEAGQSKHPLYQIYYRMMGVCDGVAIQKNNDLEAIERFITSLDENRLEIQDALNFRTYLGEENYKIYCMYKREDVYSNDTYISDNLSDAEIFELTKEFYKEATRQIKIAATPQHTLSANLHNLYQIEEFKKIAKKFKNGNFIRVKVDDTVYRLRLIKINRHGDDDKDIDVEFSDMIYAPGVANDFKSIIQSAQSMASSFSYVQRQADSGKKAYTRVDDMIKRGLNSSLIRINNNDKEEVTIDNHGILARAYDPDEEEYSPEQLRITGNIMAFSQDNWQTVETALGKTTFYVYDKDTDEWYEEEGYGVCSSKVKRGIVEEVIIC